MCGYVKVAVYTNSLNLVKPIRDEKVGGFEIGELQKLELSFDYYRNS